MERVRFDSARQFTANSVPFKLNQFNSRPIQFWVAANAVRESKVKPRPPSRSDKCPFGLSARHERPKTTSSCDCPHSVPFATLTLHARFHSRRRRPRLDPIRSLNGPHSIQIHSRLRRCKFGSIHHLSSQPSTQITAEKFGNSVCNLEGPRWPRLSTLFQGQFSSRSRSIQFEFRAHAQFKSEAKGPKSHSRPG